MARNKAVVGLKVVLWLSALVPAAWLIGGLVQLRTGSSWLGANPGETLTHTTGMTTLVLLLVTLVVTPFRRISGWNPIIQLRRPLGLFAFFYALAHFSIWFLLDMQLDTARMLADVAERPYITVGFTSFVIMIPLAVTSTKGWIRRLGKKWTKLHRGVYASAVLGVIHFYWLVKADTRLPLLLGACLAVLFALRIRRGGRRPKKSASPASGRDADTPASVPQESSA